MQDLWHHIRGSWRAALFVSSCITILQLPQWLEAVDSYAFLAVGNLASAAAQAPAPRAHSAVVVRIDQETFETRYHDRSPLDRCVLLPQLQAIYGAGPRVVVVDLDLSPAVDIAPAEAECQRALYGMIATQATQHDIRTVLIHPFLAASAPTDPALDKATWQRGLEAAGAGRIRFANPDLPVSYGLTNDYFDAPGASLVAVARCLQASLDCAPVAAGTPSAVARALAAITGWLQIHPHMQKIDPRTYKRNLLSVPTGWVANDAVLEQVVRELVATSPVVFFGAAHGKNDRFLTPLGRFYGVEVHAAAFVSQSPAGWHRFLGLALDTSMGFLFGWLIAMCWDGYFDWRTSVLPGRAELAGVWMFVLAAALLAAIYITTLISRALLGWVGIWLSPVPIALGMLVEGCVSSSVEQANRRLDVARAATAAVGLVVRESRLRTAMAGLWRRFLFVGWLAVVLLSFLLTLLN